MINILKIIFLILVVLFVIGAIKERNQLVINQIASDQFVEEYTPRVCEEDEIPASINLDIDKSCDSELCKEIRSGSFKSCVRRF